MTVGLSRFSGVCRSGGAASVIALLTIAPAAAQEEPVEPPSSADASAETQPARRIPIQAGIGVLGGVPIGTFGENIDSAGGFSGHLGVGLGGSMVTVGGELAYLWYGEEKRKVPFSLTIPDVVVNVTTSNAMFLAHGRIRVQQREGRWRPYIDGLLGLTDIFTKTSIDLGSVCTGTVCSDVSPSTTNLRDVVLSYGGGGGVMIGFGSPPSAARLDISVRYLRGGEADYLRQGTIRREDGQVFLDRSRSRTDMIIVLRDFWGAVERSRWVVVGTSP
jgi:hypothetical protein